MKLITTVLTGGAFIGLVGCEMATEIDTTEYVYKGFHYVVRTRDKPSSSAGGAGEFSQWLYVCKNGKWEAVRDSGGIKFIKEHGQLSPSLVSDNVRNGGKCYKYPKKPKKMKIQLLYDGGTAGTITETVELDASDIQGD